MSARNLCSDGTSWQWIAWGFLAFYGLIFAVVATGRVPFSWRRGGKPVGRRTVLPLLVGVFLAALGGILFTISLQNSSFSAYELAKGSLSLEYLWPKASISLPVTSIDGLSVIRGRHFRKGKRTDDVAYLWVASGGTSYWSCGGSGADFEGVVDAGRAIAAAASKPVAWRERCPDPDGRVVLSSESQVTAPGRMQPASACSSPR